MNTWTHFGRHRYRTDGDIIYVLHEGTLTVEELGIELDLFDSLGARYGHAYLIIDGSQKAPPLSPELRRYAAERYRNKKPPGTTILFGAGLLTRTAAILVNKALRLLGGAADIYFTETEAQAVALVAKLRDKHRISSV